jgi:hypothetical protein
MSSASDSASQLTDALAGVIREALQDQPTADLDRDVLVARLAPALSARLAQAAVTAGATVPRLTRALALRSGGGAHSEVDSDEERVLGALRRHSAGRSPGVTPESLVVLTGLPQHVLGPVVSTLVQAGELVRDGWLVRLPAPDDLLPGARISRERGTESRQVEERRAIGDRRRLGERRLYERRSLNEE